MSVYKESKRRPDAATPGVLSAELDPAVEEAAAGFTVVPAALLIFTEDTELGAIAPVPVFVAGAPFALIAN